MKLTKRIKQLLFGLVWGDGIITTLICIVKPRLGALLALVNIFAILVILVLVLFLMSYKSFVNDEF